MLKLIAAIEAKQTGRIFASRLKLTDITFEPRPLTSIQDYSKTEYWTGVEIGVRSSVDVRDKHNLKAILDQARRRIANEIYGEIEHEVFIMLEEMWDEELGPNSPPVKRAERLLRLLKGDDL